MPHGANGGNAMRLSTIIRMSLLGILIAAGVILYPGSEAAGPGGSAVNGVIPSPVTVTPLPARPS